MSKVVYVQKRRSLLPILLIIILLVPFIFGGLFFYAITKLQFSFPRLYVTRKEWVLYVTLEIDVTNPTMVPIPPLTYYVKITINAKTLFHIFSEKIGSLNPHEKTTLKFRTAINFALFKDLFWILVDYISGKGVRIYAFFQFKLYDFPILTKEMNVNL